MALRQQHECLYEASSPLYHDRMEREKKWKEISAPLNKIHIYLHITVPFFSTAVFSAHNTALKNAAVAKSCLLVNFVVVKKFHQVQDGK